MNQWSDRSRAKLETCHPDIQLWATEVLAVHDCSVIWGGRDKKTQNKMFKDRATQKQWPDSMHNPVPSMAIDLAPYRPNANMWEFKYSLYFAGIALGIGDYMFKIGQIGHRIRWGGNWSTKRDGRSPLDVTFYDGLHFELR